MADLEQANWIDILTTVVSFRSVYYTADFDMYTGLEIRFEISDTGNIVPYFTIQSLVDSGRDPTWVALLSLCIIFSAIQMVIDVGLAWKTLQD